MGNETSTLSERELREREIKTMDASMRKRLGRAQVVNMRVILRGARGTGKSSLFRRLEQKGFSDSYSPTAAIDVTQIEWSYKVRDFAAKLELWDIVDRARKSSANERFRVSEQDAEMDDHQGLPPLPDLEAQGAGSHRVRALDSSVVNVYKGAHAVVFMLDPSKPSTFEYVQSHIQKVPLNCGILIIANFKDRSKDRVISVNQVRQLASQAQKKGHSAAALEASMLNEFGMDGVRTFINLVMLDIQKKHLEAQLESNRNESSVVREELGLIVNEQNYSEYVKRLVEMRKNKGRRANPPPSRRSQNVASGNRNQRPGHTQPHANRAISKPSQVPSTSHPKMENTRPLTTSHPQRETGTKTQKSTIAAPKDDLNAFLDDVSDEGDDQYEWSDDEVDNRLVTQDADITPIVKRAKPAHIAASSKKTPSSHVPLEKRFVDASVTASEHFGEADVNQKERPPSIEKKVPKPQATTNHQNHRDAASEESVTKVKPVSTSQSVQVDVAGSPDLVASSEPSRVQENSKQSQEDSQGSPQVSMALPTEEPVEKSTPENKVKDEDDEDMLASFAPDDTPLDLGSFSDDDEEGMKGFDEEAFGKDDSQGDFGVEDEQAGFYDDSDDEPAVNPFVVKDADFGEVSSSPVVNMKPVEMPPSPAVPRIRPLASPAPKRTNGVSIPKIGEKKETTQDEGNDALAAILAQAAASLQAEVQAIQKKSEIPVPTFKDESQKSSERGHRRRKHRSSRKSREGEEGEHGRHRHGRRRHRRHRRERNGGDGETPSGDLDEL